MKPSSADLTSQPTAMQRHYATFWERLKEVSRFFQGRDQVHKTMRRLARRLERAKIPYAVLGGMAVYLHGHRQATGDVDILLTADGFTRFRERFVPGKYRPLPQRLCRFVDEKNEIGVDVRLTGRYPGSGRPGPTAFPDPAQVAETIHEVKLVDLLTLIRLKLAARRYQDLADVGSLIRVHNLDESFAGRLHSSLRRDYIECLEEKRREDEYEAREG